MFFSIIQIFTAYVNTYFSTFSYLKCRALIIIIVLVHTDGYDSDLLPVHRSYPTRQVPVAAVPGVHGDAVIFTRQYSALYVPHDTTIVRLRTDSRKNK